MLGMRRQAVGERLSTLQNPHHIENNRTESALRGKLGNDRKGAVKWDARVQKGRKLLREKKDVFTAGCTKRRQLKLESFGFFQADVDRNQALAAQFAGNELVVFRSQLSGASLPIGSHCTEKKSRGH